MSLRTFLQRLRPSLRRGHRPQQPKKCRPELESLECRLAPAISFFFTDGPTTTIGGSPFDDTLELRISGTSTDIYSDGVFLINVPSTTFNVMDIGGNDTLIVSDAAYAFGDSYTIREGQLTIPSFGYVVNFSNHENLTLVTGSGNDTINVEGTAAGTPVTVNAGLGNDTLNVSPEARFLDNIQGNLTFNGGAGSDRLNVYDQNNPFSDTYTLTATSVGRSFSATINYSDTEYLEVYGGSGNVTYNIESTLSTLFPFTVPTATRVYAGAGNDTFNVSPGARNLVTVPGLWVNGGDGHDTLRVFDNYCDTYWIYDEGLIALSLGDLPTSPYYSNFERVELYTQPCSTVFDETSAAVEFERFDV